MLTENSLSSILSGHITCNYFDSSAPCGLIELILGSLVTTVAFNLLSLGLYTIVPGVVVFVTLFVVLLIGKQITLSSGRIFLERPFIKTAAIVVFLLITIWLFISADGAYKDKLILEQNRAVYEIDKSFSLLETKLANSQTPENQRAEAIEYLDRLRLRLVDTKITAEKALEFFPPTSDEATITRNNINKIDGLIKEIEAVLALEQS